MKILAVNGSSRVKGNTYAVLTSILEGAAGNGHETFMFEMADHRIEPCIACRECKKGSFRCVLEDEMAEFYDIAEKVDYLILGTPVYMDNVASNMAIFLQRLYCYLDTSIKSHYPNPDTKVIVVITYGLDYPDQYIQVMARVSNVMRRFFKLDIVQKIAVHGTKNDEILTIDHPLMQHAHEIGASLE